MKKILACLFISAVCITATAQQNNNTVLWKISGNGLGTDSWLFGTMHIAKSAALNFEDSVYSAINASKAFYGELDYSKSIYEEYTGNESFFEDKGRYLDSIVKTDNWKRLVARTNAHYHKNINPDSIQEFISFSTDYLKELYTPEPGIGIMDMMLGQHAISLGKKMGGLETYLFQIDMLYNILSARLQDTSLSFEEDFKLNTGLEKFYMAQQLDSISNLINRINPLYRQIMFSNRNKTMSDSIARLVVQQPVFIAVGAGHLAGDDGLLVLLRNKGFTLTPVHSSNRMSLLLINEIKETYGAAKTGVTEKVDDSIEEKIEFPMPPEPPAAEKPAKPVKKKTATKVVKNKKQN